LCSYDNPVPLDCMHLIELGVMRKFLERIYYNKVINKVSQQNQNSISAKLTLMRTFIPREFSRKSRTLLELLTGKALSLGSFYYTLVL